MKRTSARSIAALLAFSITLLLPTSGCTPPEGYKTHTIPWILALPFGFGGGTIYYPSDENRFHRHHGLVVVVGGIFSGELPTFGPPLAQRGYIVLTLNQISTLLDTPLARAEQATKAIDWVLEHAPAEILDALDPDKIAMMGHSAGGRASMEVSRWRPHQIKTIIPLSPGGTAEEALNEWLGNGKTPVPDITVPTLMIACENDAAVNWHPLFLYQHIDPGPPKAFVERYDTRPQYPGHACSNYWDPGGPLEVAIVNWLGRYLDQDSGYTACPPVSPSSAQFQDVKTMMYQDCW